MIKRIKLINSAVVISATILTVAYLIADSKTQALANSVNNVALTVHAGQKNEPSESVHENTKPSEASSEEENEVKLHTYVVKPGDTLETIAKKFKVKISTISESNNLTEESLIIEGQILEFPSIDGVLYTIKNGETLWDLALLNKVDFDKIVDINKLKSPEKLKIGQKIIVPEVAKVMSSANKASVNNIALSRGGSIPVTLSAILPVNGKLTSKFGPRWGRQHEGIDLAAPTGTDVLASMSGIVTFSGWDGGYGKLIIIDHGNGLQTYYGHNSRLLVEKGETVEKGEHIADVGSTGNSTGPHSHFEIRKNGTPVNPLNYIK